MNYTWDAAVLLAVSHVFVYNLLESILKMAGKSYML